ncbi:MAG TPA: amino acid adenylation domain-containing protein [Thermoanaerobaculia bacterium]|jgi:amino acid adenylation domain-containing protein
MRLRDLYRGLSSLSPEQRALLARRLEASGHAGAEPALVPRPRPEEPVAVSLMQQRLWLLDQMEPGNPFYNLPLLCFEIDGPLDPALLARCFAAIERRHEALRTVFRYAGDQPVQVVLPGPVRRLETVDLSGLPPEAAGAEARALARAEARRTFDLAAGPLWRTTLLRLAADRCWMMIALHHIAADAWSLGVLYRELTALYEAAAAGRPLAAALPPLPVQFPDFALWQRGRLRGEYLEEEIAFWRGQLAGAPGRLELPTDRPHPAARSYRGERQTAAVPAALPEALHRLTQEAGASLYMVLLAAWGILLHRYTGQEDFLIASPVASRNRLEIEGLIGFFVNTVLHRLRFDGGPTVRELLARVRDVVLEVYEHQELPFDRLVEALAPRRDPRYGTLYQSIVSLQNTPTPDLELAGLTVRPRGIDSGTCQTDLILFAGLERGRLGAIQIEYATDLFDAATIGRLQEHFLTLLAAAAGDPQRRISDLPLLTPAERRQIAAWAGPYADAPLASDLPLHRLFELQAARTPAATALVHGAGRLTYGELERRANRLAHRLRALGVGPESRVGLCLERSLELPVALLAILKAGGAYVPLDPEHPAARLRFVLEDAGVAVLVTRGELLDRLPEVPVRRLLLDEAELAGEPDTPPDGPGDAGCLAYVIYTSGSTGTPKGAGITHGNATSLLAAAREAVPCGPDDVWSIFHSFAFDYSVWELWGALLHGGAAVVVPQEVTRSPEAFLELLAAAGVTCLCQTPSAFCQLLRALEADPRPLALRALMLAAETLEAAILAPWFALPAAAGVRVLNLYGITETTVLISHREMTPADLALPRSRIGRPFSPFSLHLVDRCFEPVPAGVMGEIAVGGAGVGRGYLGRPELTAARFVPDPFAAAPGARLYRTGDLARRLPDGDVEFLGRGDHQVKVRGLRIELGEIEAALARQPGVREAVVVARSDRSDGSDGSVGSLVAYLTGAPAPFHELRAGLRAELPDYMMPAAFVLLENLPLTANGKVDRRALPEPERLRPELAEEYLAPRTPTEELLAEIWRELLPVDRVGALDDFFALGGHSLLAARLASRLRERLRLEVSAQVIFQSPTLAALAGSLDQMRAAEPPAAAPALVATPRRVRAGRTGA